MSHKSKLSIEGKVQIVQDCIEGRIGQTEAARRVGVDESSVRGWIAKYESEGSSGLFQTEKNRVYSEELKLQAVTEYMAGGVSLLEVCKRHKIRSKKIQSHHRPNAIKSGNIRQKSFVKMQKTT